MSVPGGVTIERVVETVQPCVPALLAAGARPDGGPDRKCGGCRSLTLTVDVLRMGMAAAGCMQWVRAVAGDGRGESRRRHVGPAPGGGGGFEVDPRYDPGSTRLSWPDLIWLRVRNTVPIVLKGILNPGGCGHLAWRSLGALTATRQVCLSFVIDMGSMVGDIRQGAETVTCLLGPTTCGSRRCDGGWQGAARGRRYRLGCGVPPARPADSSRRTRGLDMRWVDSSHLREPSQAEGPRSGRSLIVLVDATTCMRARRRGPRSILPHCPRLTRRS